MNRRGRKHKPLGETGGAHILVLALLALGSILIISITAFNAALVYSLHSGVKPLLDAATHAAAMQVNPVEASYGRIVWDSAGGTQAFYQSLQRNLRLNASDQPLAGSPLVSAPIIHTLEYVTAPGYPYDYSLSLMLYTGTRMETLRSIHTRLYGPSVVAVMEVRQRPIGNGSAEPLILTSVSSMRPRY